MDPFGFGKIIAENWDILKMYPGAFGSVLGFGFILGLAITKIFLNERLTKQQMRIADLEKVLDGKLSASFLPPSPRKRSKRMSLGLILIFVGATVAILGAVIVALDRPTAPAPAKVVTVSTDAPQSTTQLGSGNPLMDAIDSFLAKSGKKVKWVPGGLVQMGDASDGKGPFITYWDASLGAWPEPVTGSGFTVNQLRALPRKIPKFSTQVDREAFRTALGKLSDVINHQARTMVSKSEALMAEIPLSYSPQMQGSPLDQFIQQIDDVETLWSSVNDYFKNETWLKEYPLYRSELAGTLPLPTDQEKWMRNFQQAAANFHSFLALIKSIQKHPDDKTSLEQTANIYPFLRGEFGRATGDVRDWITDCNRRIEMMMRSL